MPKTKTLNGLAYSLAQSYFSTRNYYDKGYLSDWLVNAANEKGISQIKIDVLSKDIYPPILKIPALLVYIDSLEPIVTKTLLNNQLPKDFFSEIIFDIRVYADRKMICTCFAVGKNDRIYKAGDYIEESFEKFQVFDIRLKMRITDWWKRNLGMVRFYLWQQFNLGSLKRTRRLGNREQKKISHNDLR